VLGQLLRIEVHRQRWRHAGNGDADSADEAD
jgi:hypothetical protein